MGLKYVTGCRGENRYALMLARLCAPVLSVMILLRASPAVADGGANTDAVTHIDQLTYLLKSKTRQVFQANLTGVVYGVDHVHSCLALRDGSGWLWLEADAVPANVVEGSIISAQGTLVVGKDHAYLGHTKIVEGDEYNDFTEQSGRVYLSAGQHPFELDYHKFRKNASLSVEYEGPDVSRRKLKGSMLQHADPANPGTFLPAMEFECFRDISADNPDLTKLTPSFSGSTSNFTDQPVQTSNNRKTTVPSQNYVLRFCGSLRIDQPGIYQFYIRANDGATLDLDYHGECSIRVIGNTNLVAPAAMLPVQHWGDLPVPLWSVFEGRISTVGGVNGNVYLNLQGDSGAMRVFVSEGNIGAGPLLINSYARLIGLASPAESFRGGKIAGSLTVPAMDDIGIIDAPEANWQACTEYKIRDLVKSEKHDHEFVTFRGSVTDAVPGKSLTVTDQSGTVEIRTPLANAGDVGNEVQVMGQAYSTNGSTVIHYSTYRGLGTETGQSLPLLTSIDQIQKLKAGDTNITYKFRFRAFVINVVSGGIKGAVCDETAGISVEPLSAQQSILHLGDLCEFEGVVQWWQNHPRAVYSSFKLIGHGQMPEPLHPTWNELINGSMRSRWVEVEGLVLNIKPSSSLVNIQLPGGDLAVHVASNDNDLYFRCANAVIRVRGVVNSSFNQNDHMTDAFLDVNSLADITVVIPPPRDVFKLPTRKVTEVLAVDPDVAASPYVKVSGQIIYRRGATYYLMDGTNGMHFSIAKKDEWQVGDVVDVVGVPLNDRLSRHLREASVRKLKSAPLAAPLIVAPEKVTVDHYESTLIQIETRLVGVNITPTEELFELQLSPSHVAVARLDNRDGQSLHIQPQSIVRVTGVFTGAYKAGDTVPEILLAGPNDLVVLKSPPWWNVQRTFMLLGAVSLALVGSVTWIRSLRRRVEQRTAELRAEVAEHQQTEDSLHEKAIQLQNEIDERKRIQLEVETIHRQLVDASRQAGQAEIAVNVLHNVGNVLNSVNVSAAVAADRIRKLRTGSVAKAADALEQHAAAFVANEEKGRQLVQFLRQLSAHLASEQEGLLAELKGLGQNVEHIKEIVATQQAYAKRVGVYENISPREIVENALKVHSAAFARHEVKLVRDYQAVPEGLLDKHKVLQILVNFFQNAQQACDAAKAAQKVVTVRIQNSDPGYFSIEIADNGVGIAPENLNQIFTHGFTTRQDGHGFGLHSAALAAKEMGGSLIVHSDGIGRGAKFILRLPFRPPTKGKAPPADKPAPATEDTPRGEVHSGVAA